MPDSIIRIKAEDFASALIGQVNAAQKQMGDVAVQVSGQMVGANQATARSLGTVSADLILARKNVADLRAVVLDSANTPGLFKEASKELDAAIPKVKALEAEMKALTGGVNQTTTAGGGFADWLSKGNNLLATFGVGLSVGAVVSFGKALLDDADALVRLHDKTGVSMQNLQRFQIAGDDAGNSLEQLTSAISQMENRLSSGDKSAVAALAKMGVAFEDIEHLSPENQFYAISEAIRGIKDPALQTQIAMDLFGKSGAEILPTLKRGFDDVRNAAVGMSDETARTLEEAGTIWGAMMRNFKAGAAEGLVALVHLGQDGFTPMGHLAGEAVREIERARAEIQSMTDKIPPAKKAMGEMFKPILSDSPEVTRWLAEEKKRMDDAAAAAKRSTEEHRRFTDSVKDATVATSLGVFTLNSYGATALPNVTSSLKGADLAVEAFDDDLRALLASVEAQSQPAKKFTGALDELGESATVASTGVYDLIDQTAFVGPTLDQAHDAAKNATSGMGDLSQAFANLAQISGDSFGGIVQIVGQMVGAINVAEKAAQNLSKTFASTAAGFVGVVGALYGVYQAASAAWDGVSELQQRLNSVRDSVQEFLAQFESPADFFAQLQTDFEILGRTAEDAQAAYREFFAGVAQGGVVAQAAVAKLSAEMRHANEILAGATQFGLGHDQAVAAEKTAHEIFDYMQQSGQYTKDQLEKAYYAWQKAMADAGDEMAKAWVKAHDAATSGAVTVNSAFDELVKRRESLAQSVANEAPEEVMGVIEAQTRGQMDALDRQMAEMRSSMEDQADGLAEALEHAMTQIDPQAVHIPIVWDIPALPTGGGGEAPEPDGFATGGYRDFGAGTLAVLHGREAIVPIDRPSSIGAHLVRTIQGTTAGVGGGSFSTRALEARLASLEASLDRRSEKMEWLMRTLPGALRHAMRGAA